MGAVLQVQPHPGDARFAVVALAVVVAIGVHIAEQETAVAEHAGQHLHQRAALVAELGQRPGGRRLRAVDAVAAQRAGADTHPVGQRQHGGVVERAHVEHQRRSNLAFGFGQHRAVVARAAAIDARAAPQVSEAGRQAVVDANAAEQLAGDVLDLDLVVDKLTQLDGAARGGFLDEKPGPGVGIERDVEVHRFALGGDGELRAVGTRIDQPLGRLQAGGQRRRESVGRRRHHLQAVNAGRNQREAVCAVGAGGQHVRGGGHAVVQKDVRQSVRVTAVARAGHVEQADHRACQQRAGLAVEDHAERIDQHVGLQQGGAAAGHRNGQLVVRLDA